MRKSSSKSKDFSRIPTNSPRESNSIAWEAPEFEYRPKDVSWYWLSLIASIILVTLAIWQRNFLFAVFIAVAWVAVISFTGRQPTFWEFKADEKGILIALAGKSDEYSKFYSLTEMQGFDIHEGTEDYKELVLRLKSRFSPFLKIYFPGRREEEMVRLFSKLIPREEYEDSVADSLSKLIRF